MSDCSYIDVRLTTSNKMSFLGEIQHPIWSQKYKSCLLHITNKEKKWSSAFIMSLKNKVLGKQFSMSLFSSKSCKKLPRPEKKHIFSEYPAPLQVFFYTKMSWLSYLVDWNHFSFQFHEINYILVNSGLDIPTEMKYKVMQNSLLNYFFRIRYVKMSVNCLAKKKMSVN